MTPEQREAILQPFGDGPAEGQRVRRIAQILLAVQVLAIFCVFFVGGEELFRATKWLLIPGYLGTFGASGILRHPERVERLLQNHNPGNIISDEGVQLEGLSPRPSKAGAQLAIQDALDSVRRQRGRRYQSVGGLVAAGVGTLGWLGGGIVSVLANDLTSTCICALGAAGFAGTGLFIKRCFSRVREAEAVLEAQMKRFEPQTSKPIAEGG